MSHPNLAADLAMRAIEAGTDRQYKTSDRLHGLGTDISDVLANLRHLCDRYGLAFHELDERAYSNYVGDKQTFTNGRPADRREWDDPKPTPTHDDEEVSVAFNAACDDILSAIEAPDEGVRDALNLLVNAGMYYLDPTNSNDLDEVVEAHYQVGEGEDGPIEWAKVACR